MLYESFETTRGHIHPRQAPAQAHALDILRLERRFGLARERSVQHAFIHHVGLLQTLDLYYGTVHFLLPVAALVALWGAMPERYAHRRSTFLVMCWLALAVFAFYPVMPPRLLPAHYGFVDTARSFGGMGILDPKSMKDTNPYAAMPSLHVGWALFSTWALWPVVRRTAARAALVVYPLLTFYVVVVTANHWVLDAAGGVVVLIVAAALARLVESAADRVRRSPAPSPAAALPADAEAA